MFSINVKVFYLRFLRKIKQIKKKGKTATYMEFCIYIVGIRMYIIRQNNVTLGCSVK